jgi:hypothetical protein
MDAQIQNYESKIAPARRRFTAQRAVKALLEPGLPALKLEAFFIYYNALGVRMTEHVESWIERAGRRCTELGYAALGDALRAHARHEAGHHLMMIADTRHLVRQRNARLGTALSADALLATPLTAGVRRYVDLHEHTIASDAAFGQLAIEYEIERLSVDLGGPVLERCAQALGRDVLSGLSFLQEHVEIDVGHTKLNARALGRFIAEFPHTEDALVRKGEEALDAYAAFVDDCFVLADGLPPKDAAFRPSREEPVGATLTSR